jgi:hypothetical protein
VSENRVLWRIYGPKKDEVVGGWRKLHNEELHNLHAPLNVIRVVINSRIRWAGHVADMGEMRNVKKYSGWKMCREHSEDPGVDGRIILEWMLGKQGGKLWTGCIWHRI